MIKVRSIISGDIREVEDTHYDEVLLKQGLWIAIPRELPSAPKPTLKEKIFKYFMEIKV